VAFSTHEDLAGNPFHLAIIVLAFALLLLPSARTPDAVRYAACLLAAAALFCVVLKWQPWNSRLHLPIFLLAMPWVAIVFERTLPRPVIWLLATMLLVASIPFEFLNPTRPLWGQNSVLVTDRSLQYFANQPDLEATYRAITAYPYGMCRQVGLIIGGDNWEYPFWALLPPDQPLHFEHVSVQNESSARATPVEPCAVIAPPDMMVTVNEVEYVRVLDAGAFALFRGAERSVTSAPR
jgi:hypothetical protein